MDFIVLIKMFFGHLFKEIDIKIIAILAEENDAIAVRNV